MFILFLFSSWLLTVFMDVPVDLSWVLFICTGMSSIIDGDSLTYLKKLVNNLDTIFKNLTPSHPAISFLILHRFSLLIRAISLIKQSWTSIADPKTNASPQTQTMMVSTLLQLKTQAVTQQQVTEQATPQFSDP